MKTRRLYLIYDFNENVLNVKDPLTDSLISSDEYFYGYMVKAKTTIEARYDSPEKNTLLIKLSDSMNVRGKIDIFVTINTKKNQMISKLLALNSQVFDLFMKKVIDHD